MSEFALARYLSSGALDPSFNSDGKVIVTFGEGAGRALSVAIDAQARIVAAGSFAITVTQFAVARLLTNGDLDRSFSNDGRARVRFREGPSTAAALAIDAQGRIAVAGRVQTEDGTAFGVARLRDDGSLDESFNGTGRVVTLFSDGPAFARGVSIDGLGRIVVAGSVSVGFFGIGRDIALVRYLPDGSLDTSFGGDGRLQFRFQGRDEAFAVQHDARGRIVIAGPSRSGSLVDAAVARLRPEGSLDATFGVNGVAFSDFGGLRAESFALDLDQQGRIVVAGLTRGDLNEFGVARFLSDGAHDQSFSGDGRVSSGMFATDGARAVAVDQAGRIVAVGSTGTPGEGTVFGLARFLADGTADRSFGLNGQVFTNFTEGSDDRAFGVAIDAQSRIVVAGAIGHPRDWPLAHGPFLASERLITGIQVPNNDTPFDAVVTYPATRERDNAPFAAGGPFPLIAYSHGNRSIGVPPCPGTPTDFSQDFRQLSVISRHLARFGYVVISSDQSRNIQEFLKAEMMTATIQRLLDENARDGSPFRGQIRTSGISLLGHSTGGGAAIDVAKSDDFDIVSVATLAPGTNVPSVAADIGAPLLVILGSADSSAVSGNGQEVFDSAVAPKHFVFVTGANHFGFTDELCAEGDGPPTIARADQQRIARAYLTAFFQRYVRGEASNATYLNGRRQVETLEGFGIEVTAVT